MYFYFYKRLKIAEMLNAKKTSNLIASHLQNMSDISTFIYDEIDYFYAVCIVIPVIGMSR